MLRIFSAAGREAEFFQVKDPGQIKALATRAVDLAIQRGGVVVAAGGDGTINAVAAAVLGRHCPFGVLPQGTFNYFARANAIPQDTEGAARALVGAHVSPVKVGQVNGKVFLVNASLGLYPEVLQDREAWKRRIGRNRLVAFGSAIVTLAQARNSLQLQIELDGKNVSMRTLTLFVGNNPLQLSRVGIRESLVEAVAEGGRLAGITVRHVGTLALFGSMLRGLLGNMGDDNNIESFSFRRLTVTAKHKKHLKVAIDGEVMSMQSPIVFEVVPAPLFLLIPAPEDRAEIA